MQTVDGKRLWRLGVALSSLGINYYGVVPAWSACEISTAKASCRRPCTYQVLGFVLKVVACMCTYIGFRFLEVQVHASGFQILGFQFLSFRFRLEAFRF